MHNLLIKNYAMCDTLVLNVIFKNDFIFAGAQLKQWFTNIRDSYNRADKGLTSTKSGSGRAAVTQPRAQFLLDHASFLHGCVTRIGSRISNAPGKEGLNTVSIFAWPNYVPKKFILSLDQIM